jgi:hypothetical protein
MEEFVDIGVVLCLGQIGGIAQNVAILKGRAESDNGAHPVRRIRPQNLPLAHRFHQIVSITPWPQTRSQNRTLIRCLGL